VLAATTRLDFTARTLARAAGIGRIVRGAMTDGGDEEDSKERPIAEFMA
jgi:hypothetical protein